MSQGWTFKTRDIAERFDSHVREQLPWYELATESVQCLARHYLPRGGMVYDIGSSTGNIGRSLAGLLTEREARLIAIDDSEAMDEKYNAPGEHVVADACSFNYEEFDVAICFLVLMFLPIQERATLLRTLKRKVRPGGAIIIVDKAWAPYGYIGSVLRRMTMHWKMRNGATPQEIIEKELSLSGVQRPLHPLELEGAVEFFRLGEFAGWVVESWRAA